MFVTAAMMVCVRGAGKKYPGREIDEKTYGDSSL
jgi:hypothetical protein